MKILLFKVVGTFIVLTCVFLVANITISNVSYKAEIEVSKFIIKDGKPHPLVVVFGGSEGGDSFKDSPRAYQSLQKLGFSVISIAYFGTDNTPPFLMEISLNNIMARVKEIASSPEIKNNCISLIGGSRGGELVLLLGSLFEDVNLVVAHTPSHVVYPAVMLSVPQRSAWQYNRNPVPFLTMEQFTYSQIEGYLTGNSKEPFLRAMENSDAVKDAVINVEDIQGPILLISGKYDEVWPSFEMSNKIMERLDKNKFQFDYKHIAQNTGHNIGSLRSTWQETLAFLDEQINRKNACNKQFRVTY